MGSAYGFGGIGKIIGPLGLAMIVRLEQLLKPDVPLPRFRRPSSISAAGS